MALTEKEIADIRRKTTFEIPATAEAHAEVLSRTMWKPKPLIIPKNTLTAAAYQQVLVRMYQILSNYPKGAYPEFKQRLTYHYKIWSKYQKVSKEIRQGCPLGRTPSKGMPKLSKERDQLGKEVSKEIQKTEKLLPGLKQVIPQSMFDLVLDNWHLITSKNFKIN